MMVLGCSHGEPKIIPLPIVGKFAGYCVPRSKDTCGTEAGFPVNGYCSQRLWSEPIAGSSGVGFVLDFTTSQVVLMREPLDLVFPRV
jgi:hypothetical protein